jgi:hypothetical protein
MPDNFTVDKIVTKDLTIDISADDDLTDALDLRGKALVGIVTPAALTSTSMTFKFSHDSGTTFTDLYDSSGNQVSITVAASRFIGLLAEDFVGATHIKLATGSGEAADRTITAVMRAV